MFPEYQRNLEKGPQSHDNTIFFNIMCKGSNPDDNIPNIH